jgi:hypothetical protein
MIKNIQNSETYKNILLLNSSEDDNFLSLFENMIYKEQNFNIILNEFIDFFNWRYSDQIEDEKKLLYEANDDYLSFIFNFTHIILNNFKKINFDSFLFSFKNFLMLKIYKTIFGQYKNNFKEQDNVNI